MGIFRRLFSIAAVLVVSAIYVNASAISFQIIQHDKSQNEVRESSSVIENAMFEFFFDRGFITTNSPTVSTDGNRDDMKIFSRSLIEAKMGQCNYFIVLTIDYNANLSRNPKGSILSNIDSVSWEVYETKTSQKIAEGSRKVGKVPVQKNNEKGIVSFANEIAADIYDSL